MRPASEQQHHDQWCLVATPSGPVRVTFDNIGITSLQFTEDTGSTGGTEPLSRDAQSIADLLTRELADWFAGTLHEFSVPVSLHGTPFQLSVWNQLKQIPYGTTITYSKLSERLGNPDAIRAAAHAVGSNPVLILVPCHRVIGAKGELTGYAGGLHRKKLFLELEGSLQRDRQLELPL